MVFSYLKHIVSVFMRNRSHTAALSFGEQLRRIHMVLGDELTEQVLREFVPQGTKMKVLCWMLRGHHAFLCWLTAAVGDVAQRRGQRLFKTVLRRGA